jgi:uncharacterized protein (TIGR02466 family)
MIPVAGKQSNGLEPSEVRGIFTTPLYVVNTQRVLTQDESNYVHSLKKDTILNVGANYNTKNSYVLNEKILENLKNVIMLYVKDYFTKVLSTNAQPYITQSWLNYQTQNQSHHMHDHPNSIVSGVYYIKTDETDTVSFHKRIYETILLDKTSLNPYNANDVSTSVRTGDLIMFPSSLLHSVNKKETINERISLAFNVFVKGKIGIPEAMAELVL